MTMHWSEQITFERVLLLAFLAGQWLERWRQTRASLRSQGERIGVVEDRISKLEGKAAPR